LTIANPQGLLRPGMIATLSLGRPVKSAPVTVAPLSAIVRGKGALEFAVMVVEGKRARLKPVTLGETYGDRVAVSGVAAGGRVISNGAGVVSDGEAVEVIE